MALTIKIKRATRSQLNTAASASELVQGEPYLITDENKIAVGLSATTYEVFAKDSSIPVKATGAEINTGTDDAKFATPKAIEDSDIGKVLVGINEQTGTTYTLALTDAGKLVRISNAAAITLTIPTNTSVAFATGTRILVEQQGAGVITVSPVDGNVTINSTAKKTWGQYSVIELVKLNTNLWNVIGGSV